MSPSRRSLLAGFLALPVAVKLGRFERPLAFDAYVGFTTAYAASLNALMHRMVDALRENAWMYQGYVDLPSFKAHRG